LIIASAWDWECVCERDDGPGWDCCSVRARLGGREECGDVCEDVRTLLPDANDVLRLSEREINMFNQPLQDVLGSSFRRVAALP